MSDWWLKVQRAEKHMADIEQAATMYASSHPYSFTRIRLPDSKNEIRARFKITKQPDPMIAVMLGDFIHNLRCALDYIVVACAPKKYRKHANFPILYQDIFAKNKDGQFEVKDDCLRDNFETATKGLHPSAKSLIISLQPYQALSLGFPPDNALGVLNRLENADKHRKLITVGCGGQEGTLSFIVRGFTEPIIYHQMLGVGTQFLKDNTIIPFVLPPDFNKIRHLDGTFIKPSDVEMRLSTTAKILVDVPMIGGNQPPMNMLIDDIMSTSIFDVRGILTQLEPFIISK